MGKLVDKPFYQAVLLLLALFLHNCSSTQQENIDSQLSQEDLADNLDQENFSNSNDVVAETQDDLAEFGQESFSDNLGEDTFGFEGEGGQEFVVANPESINSDVIGEAEQIAEQDDGFGANDSLNGSDFQFDDSLEGGFEFGNDTIPEGQDSTNDQGFIAEDPVAFGNNQEVLFNDNGGDPTSEQVTDVFPADPISQNPSEDLSEASDEIILLPEQADVLPIFFTLTWVGYEYLRDEKILKVEILTTGKPEFKLFYERNQLGQPELVVRFMQTAVRKKIKWDINSSEFRSPVAYIRMRHDSELGLSDVVLTMRSFVKPQFFAKDSNITLTFSIPERYFGRQEVAELDPVDQAKPLTDADLLLDVEQGSELPATASTSLPVTNPPNDFAPVDGGFEEVIEFDDSSEGQGTNVELDDSGFPQSFDSVEIHSIEFQKSLLSSLLDFKTFNLTSFSTGAVSQDNLIDGAQEAIPASDNLPDNFVFEAEPIDGGDNFSAGLSQGGQEAVGQSLEIPGNDISGDSPAQNGLPRNVSGGEEEPSESDFLDSLGNAETVGFSPEISESQPDDGFETIAGESDDLVSGENSGNGAQSSSDTKLVYLDFNEAPLGIVLKAFANETRNNFVFSKEIANIPVTVSFQGVPWDEALKAILETFSLGMVRVGDNIVRVDSLDKLTEYLSKLEKAQIFETRRIPTKVLVMRLNNAKAKDVLAQVNPLLDQVIKDDPRIKASADERTNSVVMEAPEYVLSKVKNIVSRLDLETPQVEITSRIVEVQKSNSDEFGASILNQALANFDPGRGLGFGSLNFPNSLISSFSVDSGSTDTAGQFQMRFGSINKFVDLDLILNLEENRGTTNVLQRNRVLVLDNEKASILAGSSRYFDTGGGAIIAPPAGDQGGQNGLTEVTFNLELEVTPQVTADGAVIMDLEITSDTPAEPQGSQAVDGKSTRELKTKMIRNSGDTGVIGGIYDTIRSKRYTGLPFISRIPIIGALFRTTVTEETQNELLIMVTPNIVSRQPAANFNSGGGIDDFSASGGDGFGEQAPINNGLGNIGELNNFGGNASADFQGLENSGNSFGNIDNTNAGIGANVGNGFDDGLEGLESNSGNAFGGNVFNEGANSNLAGFNNTGNSFSNFNAGPVGVEGEIETNLAVEDGDITLSNENTDGENIEELSFENEAQGQAGGFEEF